MKPVKRAVRNNPLKCIAWSGQTNRFLIMVLNISILEDLNNIQPKQTR